MSNYKLNSNIFREYDIRGIVEKDFSEDFIYDLGLAIGTKFINLGEKSIGISGDLRKTTKFIKTKLVEGLLNTGINVVDLGTLPTPVNYYSMYALDNVNSAIQITGSHNSMDYNGFKISYNRSPFYGESIQELKDIIKNKTYILNKSSIINKNIESIDILEDYKSLLKSKIQIKKKISIVLDCLNSCGALVAPEVFSNYKNIKLKKINCTPNGNCLSTSPDPTLDENLEELVNTVKSNNYDFGIAYDGDADRLVAVDDRGKIIRPDILLALFSSQIISDGDKVVYDVKCSKSVEDVIKSKNGIPIMYKTGHSYIKDKMHTTNAIIGGEMSGHMFFADDYFGYDDAVYASLRLSELLSNSNKKLSELIDKIPKYHSSPEIRIKCNNDEEKFEITNKLVDYFNQRYKCNCIDGVKIIFDYGWGLIRASNTQPVLVCRYEADNVKNLKKIELIIMNQINSYL